MAETVLTPLILAGGRGVRLWPLSRTAMPKQFLLLNGPLSTFQEALRRVSGALFDTPLVITNGDFAGLAQEQAAAVGVPIELVLEPVGRDSAPAIAAGAVVALERRPDAVALALAADHVILDQGAFEDSCRTALACASGGAIVTFGITPTRPETGFGYIAREQAVDGVARVRAFREKPDLDTARALIAAGDLWNSGNFAFRAATMLAELDEHAPAVSAAVRRAVAAAHRLENGLVLDEAAFASAPRISIDHAVMEKTRSAVVLEARFDWSDVGAWDVVQETGAADADGNVVVGEATVSSARNVYVRSEGRPVAVIGVDDVMVVATDDGVLVTRKGFSAELKTVLATFGAPRSAD